ncbi:MAG TPA: glucose 1-dehydrogenase, partial [Thermomicrobiales bacterium]|nr:glucose 1-dehydrogenase [Thermomicrobiales bacterium]
SPLASRLRLGGNRMGALNGRSALVTGAGMGIGEGIARRLALAGANVALHYGGSENGAKATAADIERLGRKAIVVQGDLRHRADCERIVDAAIAAFGGLNILVNNAGVTREQPFAETTEALYDEMFDLNIKGYFFCAQRALPALETSGHGVILNITSVHGYGGAPNHVAYAATKGAIIAFTRALAVELTAKHVRVNAIGPGIIEVPRYFDRPGYTTEAGNAMVPWGRVGAPADIGQAAEFLVSDAADFITGQVLYVDGGTTARLGGNWRG